MEKVWYIKIEEEPEGPYSFEELQWDSRITLDTLAWREGMPQWLPIREITELAFLFVKPDQDQEEESEPQGDGRVLTLSHEPQFQYFLIVALVIIVLIFLYFQYLS